MNCKRISDIHVVHVHLSLKMGPCQPDYFFFFLVDRLVFVLKPITYRAIMRKSIILAQIVGTWLMAFVMVVPLTLSNQIRTDDYQCYMSMVPYYAIGMLHYHDYSGCLS